MYSVVNVGKLAGALTSGEVHTTFLMCHVTEYASFKDACILQLSDCHNATF
jgi:hypothetical protein